MEAISIDTILHGDSVLARTLKKPHWRGRMFRAVETVRFREFVAGVLAREVRGRACPCRSCL